MPTIPHRAAGWRIEPPVSVPIAQGARPAATAAALPPEEPPGTRLRSHGLSTGPKPEFSFDEPIANSSWLVLASTGAPASCSFATTVAVYGGRAGTGDAEAILHGLGGGGQNDLPGQRGLWLVGADHPGDIDHMRRRLHAVEVQLTDLLDVVEHLRQFGGHSLHFRFVELETG